MDKLIAFVKKEAVLTIAWVLALVSFVWARPSGALVEALNLPVLCLLFCLMAAVAGFNRAGVFQLAAAFLQRRFKTARSLSLALILTCFFLSALITNDVALITFVPFTVGLLGSGDKKRLIYTVVLETAAANLGSMMTPIGNPQNLFLYVYYEMELMAFFRAVLGLSALSLVLIVALSLLIKKDPLPGAEASLTRVQKAPTIRAAVIFVLSLLSVLRILPYSILFAVTIIMLVLWDQKLFGAVDYSLLVTFVGFFIFTANLSALPGVRTLMESLLIGREVPVAALISQAVSNVPAANLLAPFTADATALLKGVNIGGLGTPIASMASLISLRAYGKAEGAEKGRYLMVFTVVNVVLLVILLAAGMLGL